MNSNERLALIRARLGRKEALPQKPKGMHVMATGEASAVRKNAPWTSTGGNVSNCGLRTLRADETPAWAKQSKRPAKPALKLTNRRQAHHLDAIAEKWLHPAKTRAKV